MLKCKPTRLNVQETLSCLSYESELTTISSISLQRVLESDIRIGGYSYDVKKEEWCEVSLMVC